MDPLINLDTYEIPFSLLEKEIHLIPYEQVIAYNPLSREEQQKKIEQILMKKIYFNRLVKSQDPSLPKTFYLQDCFFHSCTLSIQDWGRIADSIQNKGYLVCLMRKGEEKSNATPSCSCTNGIAFLGVCIGKYTNIDWIRRHTLVSWHHEALKQGYLLPQKPKGEGNG